MKKIIPVLITFDVDPTKNIDIAMNKSLKLLNDLNIKSTFFYTAKMAKTSTCKKIIKEKHEIGCHALNHDDYEEFDKLPSKESRKLLKKATSILKKKSGQKITSFRSARVKISSDTLKVLQRLGYKLDSSVCSQRFDLISSNLINLGWLVSPRTPYFPNKNSAYKRGDLNILEIPVSAIILPFISTTLRIFGLTLMKVLFNLLYFESKFTGKPIVYLIHPHEFTYSKGEVKFSLKYLIPNKSWLIRGFPIRIWLGRRLDGNEVLEINKKLFQWISKKKKVKFFTMDQFRKYYCSQKESVES
jgi:hypothetical protein